MYVCMYVHAACNLVYGHTGGGLVQGVKLGVGSATLVVSISVRAPGPIVSSFVVCSDA